MLLHNTYWRCNKERGDTMAQISLRIEDDVRKKAEQACAEIGMSLSTAINIYLKNWEERSAYHLKYLRIRFILRKI